MKINALFCLSGWGYLQDMSFQRDQLMARIKMVSISPASDSDQDEVWIDCKLDKGYWQQWFNDLLLKVKKGHSVLMNFKAEYGAFVKAFACFGPEVFEETNCSHVPVRELPHIVSLRGKLLSVDTCYIDGMLVRSHYQVPLQVID